MRRVSWRVLAALIGVVACAAAGLMWIALDSLGRQGQAISRLTAANRRYAAERFIAELEYETREAVERCLKQLDPLGIRPDLERSRTSGCNWLDSFFVVDGEGMRLSSGSAVNAARVQRDLRHAGFVAPAQVYPLAYPDEPVAQFFFLRVKEYLIAGTVDLEYVQRNQVPRVRKLAEVQVRVDPLNGIDVSGGAAAHFRSLFPFWQVSAAAEPVPTHAIGNLRSFRMIAFCVAVVLFFGLGLLLHENWRYWRLNQLRVAFVTGAAHELKTPLASVRFYSDLLNNERFDVSQRAGFAQTLAREAEEMSRRIDKVLALAHIANRDRSYERRSTDLSALLERVLDDWRLRQPALRLESYLESPAPARVDASAVSDAVVNLLDNAVKYSGASDIIAVRLYKTDSQTIIEVCDSGPAIPKAEQKRLFEAFYRSPRNSGQGGFGLGLFIVQHIMRGHGGAVELESNAGRGNCFRLIFPQHETHPDRRG